MYQGLTSFKNWHFLPKILAPNFQRKIRKEKCLNGYILKNFRKDFKMTQKELAEKAGLGLDKIKKLETGKNKLTAAKFRSIKGKLGLIDKNENPLRMMIDYLRVTFKSVKDLEFFVEECLYMTYTNFTTHETGLYGYNSSLRYGNIWIFYFHDADERGNHNITLQMSGHGCREIELMFENFGFTWQTWLSHVFSFHENLNVTRLDIALDDLYLGYDRVSEHFHIPDMITKMTSGLIKTKQFKRWDHIGGGVINNENYDAPDDKGVSVYFGSPQSSMRFNFYEKRFELASKEKMTVEEALEVFGIYNRYEVRFGNGKAHPLVEKIIEGYDLGDIVRGIINERLNVYEGIDDKWGSYIPDKKWYRLFGNADYLKLSVKPEPYDVMKTVRWLYYQVSNSLAFVKEVDRIMNRNFLEDILKVGEVTENMQKQLEVLQEQIMMSDENDLIESYGAKVYRN